MRFRKKPVEILAYQWKGHLGELDEFLDACPGDRGVIIKGSELLIETLEGTMTANRDDWIICGVKGELYPCKPDIFSATYEAADEEGQGSADV